MYVIYVIKVTTAYCNKLLRTFVNRTRENNIVFDLRIGSATELVFRSPETAVAYRQTKQKRSREISDINYISLGHVRTNVPRYDLK